MRITLASLVALALIGCNTATLSYPPDLSADAADLDACYFYCGDGGDAESTTSDAAGDAAHDASVDAPQDAAADAGHDAPADAPHDGG